MIPSTPAPTRPTVAANGEMLTRVKQIRLDGALGAAKSGSSGSGWLPWLLAGMLAITWAGVAVRTYRNAPVAASVPADGSTPAATATPSGEAPPPTAGTIQLEVKGYLVPARQIAVSPIEVAGMLLESWIVEGKLFQKGDVLARIDDTNYRAQEDEARASLAAAEKRLTAAEQRRNAQMAAAVRQIEVLQTKAELAEAEAQRVRAADDYKRLQGIATTISARELVTAESDFRQTTARVEKLKATLDILLEGPRKEQIAALDADVKAAESDVKVSQARLAQAAWRVKNCVIRAPVSGTILSKKAEPGNLINPLAFSASAGSGGLCDIADLADLEVDLEIPERDISKLIVGQKCRVRADAFPNRVYDGYLDRIMPIANRAKSIVNVRVKVKLPPGEVPGTYLKPEMGAVVSFLADEKK